MMSMLVFDRRLTFMSSMNDVDVNVRKKTNINVIFYVNVVMFMSFLCSLHVFSSLWANRTTTAPPPAHQAGI